MADLTIHDINLDGVELTYVSADEEGDTFRNNGNMILFVKNTDAVDSHTVTLVAQKECNHGYLHDAEIEVSASEVAIIRDIEKGRFNDDDGKVHISYDAYTNFEIAVGV
jgi:hypothetical protein